MPLNKYVCQMCGEKFDLFSNLLEIKLDMKCPKCGAENLKQLDTANILESEESEGCEVCTTRESS